MRFLITLVLVPFILSGCSGGGRGKRGKASLYGSGLSRAQTSQQSLNVADSIETTFKDRISEDQDLDKLRTAIQQSKIGENGIENEDERWILIKQLNKMESDALKSLSKIASTLGSDSDRSARIKAIPHIDKFEHIRTLKKAFLVELGEPKSP